MNRTLVPGATLKAAFQGLAAFVFFAAFAVGLGVSLPAGAWVVLAAWFVAMNLVRPTFVARCLGEGPGLLRRP
jgi:hypothetical protein